MTVSPNAHTEAGLPVLAYADRPLRPRHSTYSILSLVVAVGFLWWASHVHQSGPPHWKTFDPVWITLYENFYLLPAVGCALAVMGILQPGRKRTCSYVALAMIAVTWVLLEPPLNFA